MVATVPLDLPANFGIGALISLASWRRLGVQGASRPFPCVWIAAAYSGWFGATVAPFYIRYQDWMWAYLFDPSWLPVGVGLPLFCVALAGSGALGAALAGRMVAKRRKGGAWATALGGLALWGVLFALMSDQYFHVGTLAQYRAGEAPYWKEQLKFYKEFQAAGVLMFLPLAVLLPVLWFFPRAGKKG